MANRVTTFVLTVALVFRADAPAVEYEGTTLTPDEARAEAAILTERLRDNDFAATPDGVRTRETVNQLLMTADIADHLATPGHSTTTETE